MSKEINLSFLNDIKLDVLAEIAPVKKAQVIKIPSDDVDIRVFSNGRVFPSAKFTAQCNLEYQDREVLPDGSFDIKGNGLDVFNSKDWGVIQGKLPQELIFVTAVSKTAAKVDLWSSTRYNEADNTPKASVFTQGATTFGKNTLVPMIADIYGVDWDKVEFVDMKMADETISSDDGVYHIPKKVASGKNKGQNTYERREHLEIHPITIVHEEPVKVKAEQGELFPNNLDTPLAPEDLGTAVEVGGVEAEWTDLGAVTE